MTFPPILDVCLLIKTSMGVQVETPVVAFELKDDTYVPPGESGRHEFWFEPAANVLRVHGYHKETRELLLTSEVEGQPYGEGYWVGPLVLPAA